MRGFGEPYGRRIRWRPFYAPPRQRLFWIALSMVDMGFFHFWVCGRTPAINLWRTSRKGETEVAEWILIRLCLGAAKRFYQAKQLGIGLFYITCVVGCYLLGGVIAASLSTDRWDFVKHLIPVWILSVLLASKVRGLGDEAIKEMREVEAEKRACRERENRKDTIRQLTETVAELQEQLASMKTPGNSQRQ